MKYYTVWRTENNEKGLLKIYPFKLQAVIYCLLKGYVEDFGRYGLVLRDDISIEEIE